MYWLFLFSCVAVLILFSVLLDNQKDRGMRWYLGFLMLFFVLAVVSRSFEMSNSFQKKELSLLGEGYDNGYKAGYNDGYRDAENWAIDNVHDDAYAEGYADGLAAR